MNLYTRFLPTKICKECNKTWIRPAQKSNKRWEASKFCSKKCAANNPELKARRIEKLKGRVISLETRRKISIASSKFRHSLESKIKMSNTQKRIGNKPPVMEGEKHPQWKGDKATYVSIHWYIGEKFGKPRECEFCHRTDRLKYDWANISGKYKRDRSDWFRLCRQCHLKFDNVLEKSWITRRKAS